MSEEKKKISYSDLPEGIRKLISTAKGRGIIKYLSEHPETLQTAIKASELRRIAADRIHSDPELQEKIRRIASRIAKDPKIQQEFFNAQRAAQQATLSGTFGDFKEHDSIVQNFGNAMGLTPWQYSEQTDSRNNAPLSDDLRKKAIYREETLNAVSKEVTGVKSKIQEFLDEFKCTVKRNEKASTVWAIATCVLSVIAIVIAVWSECSDKTRELIEVIKQSHPWSEQQISAEDAKNVRVAFQAITGALQKNVQLEKDNIQLRQETDRLQADLRKAQGDLAELQKKYNADNVVWLQGNKKLYAEITALKKQMEELKTELAKRPLRKQSPEVVK